MNNLEILQHALSSNQLLHQQAANQGYASKSAAEIHPSQANQKKARIYSSGNPLRMIKEY